MERKCMYCAKPIKREPDDLVWYHKEIDKCRMIPVPVPMGADDAVILSEKDHREREYEDLMAKEVTGKTVSRVRLYELAMEFQPFKKGR